MSYDPLKVRERGRRAAAPILLAASLLCLTISTRSLVGLPERVGVTVLGFFQKGFSALGGFVSDTLDSIAELRRLRRDYDELSAKLERFTAMERGMADLRAENGRLKEQLGFAQGEAGYERIAARIVAKDPGNLYSTIVIDKGVESGIRKNMPIVAFQDGIEGLVGRVVEAGLGTSLVVPLYDQSSYVACRLVNERHEGLVAGSGGADDPLVMRFVKKRAKDEVQFGDLVSTSGYESVYPPDIAVGRVKRVRVLEYQTSVEIDLDPVLDFSRIEYVFAFKPLSARPAGEGGGGTP
ncbi:MAG TPA: rod shape-determining protein MreC [Spirochaetia bacterium]|nr:rod shape-determining protein MreC [Spirochaetia bacterium]